MFIAFEGGIKTGEALQVGEVEITEAQYLEAIDSITSGKAVTVNGGFDIIDQPEPEPEPEPETVPSEPRLASGQLARFSFGVPVEVKENVGIGPVTRISKGRGRVYHVTPMADANYSAMPTLQDAAIKYIRITAKTAAYVEFKTWGQDNLAADVEEVTIKIEKVVS
jgi:hypothetical protein